MCRDGIKTIVRDIILNQKKGVISFNETQKEEWYDGTFVFDMSMNSLDVVEIIMACENHFSINILDETIMELNTPNDLINTIIELTKEKQK